MPNSENVYDVVVLGAGSGGYACALRAAQLGLSVALVEKDKLGGTCLHAGCIPTKALLHAAEVADSVRTAEQFGIAATFEGVDLGGVNKYKDAVVSRLHKGLAGLIHSRGITVIEGTGRLSAPNTVDVNGTVVTGTNIVLASGSYSRSLPSLVIEGDRVITSDHALGLGHIPKSVVVLGGGVIGCEFASVWKSFGAQVTIIEALPHLVPNEDVEISKQLERTYRRRKIGFKLNARFERVDQAEEGVSVVVRVEEAEETIEAELLLVAVGRGPSTEGLGYSEAGVTMDRGFVVTDDRLRTSAPGVHAVGDIVPGLQLAHRGFQQGIFVAEEIAGLAPGPIDETAIPRVTYSDPEVASVGLTEAAARELHGEVQTVTYDLGGNGKSQILKTQGFIKIVRALDGPVLGVHIIGARAGELIGEAQMIYGQGMSPEDVARLIHAHPTQNEAMGEAFLALAGKPLHAHA
jgi:dihydrolipoamide dehydrogenase